MRKAKKYISFPVGLLTPQQKLEQISLLQDDIYSFIPLIARQSKINGWINDQNLVTSRPSKQLNSLKGSIILGKAIPSPKEKINNLTKDKKILAFHKKDNDQIVKVRLKSAQLITRKPVDQILKGESVYLSKIGDMKSPLAYLRKHSSKNLSVKNKAKQKGRLSIQSINYPIFESKQLLYNPQRQYNPVSGKIRFLLQHRRNLSTRT